MRFMIQILGFIIFAFLISNIVTKLENLSVELDKNTNVEAKDYVYNTTSRNNAYIKKKKHNYNYSTKEIYNLTALTVAFAAITMCTCIYIWENTRCECNIRYIRRNCSRFSRCCVEYIHNFPNDPPPPKLIIRQPVAADYQDVYQMPSSSV
ncbi:uncharacterized protein LOC126853401 isoform X2 [Cataglyphis hispanica]|uniref:uncharacterized protein LOC126853401 isoform X2 n=1 Tax=Cataglyphis hispanica TaxID=1086592 RepID=UPI00217F5794|nr:uncharacterized protein LOC126853401 isoform X2 [Cataglyphis hispanica]XP_050455070.1 uncharacterized protein LOC126853401 isoform X2 [Cataglyphis hispanica]